MARLTAAGDLRRRRPAPARLPSSTADTKTFIASMRSICSSDYRNTDGPFIGICAPNGKVSGGRRPAEALGRRARRLGRLLCDTAAERPVLLGDLDQVDDDILAPHVQPGMEVVGDALEERLLHLDSAAGIQRDLDQDDIGRVTVAEIAVGDVEFFRGMFGDDLEFVVRS